MIPSNMGNRKKPSYKRRESDHLITLSRQISISFALLAPPVKPVEELAVPEH